MKPIPTLLLLATLPCLLPIACHGPAAPRTRAATIVTKPVFQQHRFGNSEAYHTLEADGRSIVWPEDAPRPGNLDSRRRHHFEILEEEQVLMQFGDRPLSYWSPQLTKISLDDRVLYDASICRLHDQRMTRQVVEISYGLPAFRSPYWQAMQAGFPHHGLVLGGCSVVQDRPLTWTWVCAECRTREKAWRQRNPQP